MLVLFESQVLNLKCDAGPLIFRSCFIPNAFFWTGLPIQAWTTEEQAQDRKGMARTRTAGAVVSAEWRDWGRPLWQTGSVHSLTHCTGRSADWGAFHNRTYNKPVPKLFQAWSWRLATDTYYAHFIRQACRGPAAEVATRRGRYRRCLENLRVLPPLKLLNMRRGSNLYLGRRGKRMSHHLQLPEPPSKCYVERRAGRDSKEQLSHQTGI